MKTAKKKEFSIYVDGSKITYEQFGDIKNAEKIVLFCHGFPGTSRLIRLNDNLKTKPISVVEINYRGDKKSEGKFSFLGSMNDIRTVANYLKEKYKVPIHALGYSMGGFYLTNIINKEPHFFEKVILLNPVVDTLALFSNKILMEELWRNAENILLLKTTEDYNEEIRLVTSKFNPIEFAEKLKSNITIIQSTKDEVLEPKLAKRFYTLLNGKKSYLEILNKTHDLLGDEEELIDAI